MITLALSKGRIFEETLPLLRAASIEVLDDPDKSRQLLRYFLTQLNLTNGAAGMAGTSGVPMNIILPLRVNSGESSARGTGRATYELR